MGNECDPQRRDGTRVLVIWVCWVVLTLFLIAAGVIWFG
jgi:hypothetical protein